MAKIDNLTPQTATVGDRGRLELYWPRLCRGYLPYHCRRCQDDIRVFSTASDLVTDVLASDADSSPTPTDIRSYASEWPRL